MDKKITYHEQTSRENTLKLRSVLQTLPDFTKDFFRAIEPNTSAKTRISYVYDIRLFKFRQGKHGFVTGLLVGDFIV